MVYDLEKKERAKKRVEELKGFYIHFAVYIVVNMFMTVFKVVRNIHEGETFGEAFFDSSTFFIWFFWGIGVVFHAAKVFSYNPFFGKDWEERQIHKFMHDDENKSRWE
jgi:uncharacterized protein YqhQ